MDVPVRKEPTSKVVAITGAGSGIGLAAARHYASKGWMVGLIGRGEAALTDALRQIEAEGGVAHVAIADVVDLAALEAAADAVEAALGPIEVWINNAGIGFYGAFVDVPEDAFRRVIDVNLHGTVNGTRIALARMRPRNRGTIIQVLSAISYRGVPLQSAYSTTKYGLRGFTEAVRAELINERSAVHITMVHPPSVNTPFYSHAGSVMGDKSPRPPPPVYQPEILGEAIFFAGTVKRREWRVTGETVAFSIANKIVPGLLDMAAGFAGIRVQQTARQDVADRRDPNTFTPSSRASGTHGPFDNESLKTSAQWWLSKSPAPVRVGVALLAIGLLRAARRGR
jgi:short-subunit dehydrogenase